MKKVVPYSLLLILLLACAVLVSHRIRDNSSTKEEVLVKKILSQEAEVAKLRAESETAEKEWVSAQDDHAVEIRKIAPYPNVQSPSTDKEFSGPEYQLRQEFMTSLKYYNESRDNAQKANAALDAAEQELQRLKGQRRISEAK